MWINEWITVTFLRTILFIFLGTKNNFSASGCRPSVKTSVPKICIIASKYWCIFVCFQSSSKKLFASSLICCMQYFLLYFLWYYLFRVSLFYELLCDITRNVTPCHKINFFKKISLYSILYTFSSDATRHKNFYFCPHLPYVIQRHAVVIYSDSKSCI